MELEPAPEHKPIHEAGERIAMVSTHGYVAAEPPLGAPDTGGQVVYVLELSKKLAQLGFAVDIWTRQFEDQPQIEEVAENVRIVRMPCGGEEFIPKEFLYKKLPEWGEHVLRFIKAENLSYSFINSHYWDAGLAGQHLANVLKIPHIHTPHSIGVWKKRSMEEDMPEEKDSFEVRFNFSRRIHHEKLLYRECDLVVATSPDQIDILREDYEIPRQRLRMIPPGYDDNRFYPVSKATRASIREQFGYQGNVISAIGRLARNKGFDLLIDAFSVVAERDPQAMIQMAVGAESSDPEDDEALEELFDKVRSYKLEDRVTICESLPDEEMPDFYRAADVFVLSSRYEPIGMTAIEAMACGTPTVVTTHGGLWRALNFGEDGLYADTFDKYELGIAILQILKYNQLKNRLSRDGARRVRSLFTWTGIAQQLLNAVEGQSKPTFGFADNDEEEDDEKNNENFFDT
ncbi:MAG: glycosyltransferase [Lentisphaeria bacterium]